MKKGIVIIFFVAFLIGCAHRVEFRAPDTYSYPNKVPLKAAFYMDPIIKDKTWSGRAFGSGIANRWDVPIGRVVEQYADVHLNNGFYTYSKIDDLGKKPPHDILIKIVELNYYMASQAARCDLTFVIEDSKKRGVLRKKYHEDGPSEMGRVVAGGVFAQKSAIRQSTHIVLENIFKNFLADVQVNYKEWNL